MFEHNEAFQMIKRFITVRYHYTETAEERTHTALKALDVVNIDGDNAVWSGSDYSGSTYYKSNQRRLVEDYPQFLTDETYHYDGYGLNLIVSEFLKPENREDAVHLAEILNTLADDYPVYDENDHSELEEELAVEGWDGWLRSDLKSEIETKYGITVSLRFEHYGEIMAVFSELQIYAESDGPSDVTWHDWNEPEALEAVIEWWLERGESDEYDHDDLTDLGQAFMEEWVNQPLTGQLILTYGDQMDIPTTFGGKAL